MDEKARGEAVAESTKRLGEEFSPKASTLVPKFSELLNPHVSLCSTANLPLANIAASGPPSLTREGFKLAPISRKSLAIATILCYNERSEFNQFLP